ncbi:hypothetical protein HHK36_032017 [Tetracentron sinense]|uniref:Uncharacterized protein n=1 Tax=Tetracentron sinense TaxID=13715 RepID=A0A834Y663_TETSI|nr:hypothetical protein HHK36_032017 [Tetracentron sinense]
MESETSFLLLRMVDPSFSQSPHCKDRKLKQRKVNCSLAASGIQKDEESITARKSGIDKEPRIQVVYKCSVRPEAIDRRKKMQAEMKIEKAVDTAKGTDIMVEAKLA